MSDDWEDLFIVLPERRPDLATEFQAAGFRVAHNAPLPYLDEPVWPADIDG